VLSKGELLVFCEVKTRTGTSFGEPFEAVTASKQARIRRLAVQWLRSDGSTLAERPGGLRFDVASVKGTLVEVIEAAF
jgi:putative endonuclease